jgi:hypothetical protein
MERMNNAITDPAINPTMNDLYQVSESVTRWGIPGTARI